jgi:hypothetical protein
MSEKAKAPTARTVEAIYQPLIERRSTMTREHSITLTQLAEYDVRCERDASGNVLVVQANKRGGSDVVVLSRQSAIGLAAFILDGVGAGES